MNMSRKASARAVGSPTARPALASDFAGRGVAAFGEAMAEMDLPMTKEALETVAAWFRFYSNWPGRRVIGFGDPREAAIKLIADSFAVARLAPGLPPGGAVDLGSGNGWPGLAVRLLRPSSPVVLLDSRLGACEFMRGFVERSAFSGVSVVEARAEDAWKDPGIAGRFSLAVSRAMASPAISLEVASSFLPVGGAVVLWLGPEQASIVDRSSDIRELGLSRYGGLQYDLPGGLGRRVLAVYAKVSPSLPGYPRKIPAIKAKPLL